MTTYRIKSTTPILFGDSISGEYTDLTECFELMVDYRKAIDGTLEFLSTTENPPIGITLTLVDEDEVVIFQFTVFAGHPDEVRLDCDTGADDCKTALCYDDMDELIHRLFILGGKPMTAALRCSETNEIKFIGCAFPGMERVKTGDYYIGADAIKYKVEFISTGFESDTTYVVFTDEATNTHRHMAYMEFIGNCEIDGVDLKNFTRVD